MPEIEENVETWNAAASWTAEGDEWSGPWGSAEAQWWGTLLPRLHAFLPAATTLLVGLCFAGLIHLKLISGLARLTRLGAS